MTDRYASLRQGLVGCWIPSVSGSGLLLPDLSGRGNNGSLVGMDASDWVSGQYGRALDFDGVNDYVDCGRINGIESQSNVSFSFWAKWQLNSSNLAGFFSYGASGNTTADIFMFYSSGNYRIQINNGVDGNLNFAESVPSDWTHYVVRFRGNSNAIDFYINTILQSATGTFTPPSSTASGSSGFRLWLGGYVPVPSGWEFKGQIDDFRAYNRILSEPEIKLLSSEPGIGFKRISSSAFATRYAYKPAKPRNYSVIRNRDPNYSTLRQGLVAAYCPSISGQGNVLPDLVGGNHGQLTNMSADDWVSSGDGRALEFDGSNDYVSCGTSNNSLLVQSKAFSISAWIYLTSTTSDRTILTNAKITPNYDGMNFLSAAGKLRFDLGGDASPTFPLKRKETTSAVFSTGIWYHVAVTKPASAATSAISLYVNGVQPATTDAFNDTVADAVNSVNLQIAARDGANSLLQGQIDDLRLYNRALSEPEIKLLASKRGIGLEPRKPKITFTDLGVQKTYGVVRVKETDYGNLRQGLVGAWCPSLPNGGSGNTLPDVSGYGNHGSLVNMSPDDWVSSQYGRALDFDGVDDYVSTQARVLSSNFTYSLFFSLNSSPAFPSARPCGDADEQAGTKGTSLIVTTTRLYVVNRGGSATDIDATASLSLNTWYHAAITISDKPRLYLNGNVIKESTGTTIGLWDKGWKIGIDDNSGTTLRCFPGKIDDARLYNRALSESEIRLLASRPGIGLRQDRDRNTFYQFPSGARRKRILTGMP